MTEDREKTLLGAISSEEPSTFKEFLNGLNGDVPDDRSEWKDLFTELRELEAADLVEISRANDRIDTLQLTEAGVARIKTLRK